MTSRIFQQANSILCVTLLLLFPSGAILLAQEPMPQEQPAPQESAQAPEQQFSPDQLADLVAPVALYPDALLSQVLVASTYPIEIVEAAQWLAQNRGLQGQQLVEAARGQNWDPSIQALVVFPDVLGRMASNIHWTTDLGNAFLAQQADVMNAVQHLRQEAMAAGRLQSNADQTVTNQVEDGQSAIDIQPANPDVVYVPAYNPEYVWGPPVYGYYPDLYYPGFGFGFGAGIYLGSFFGGLGWGGWGWGLNWFGHGIFVNGGFFHRYGFHDWGGRGFDGMRAWQHNPDHRMGLGYANHAVANRFGGNFAGRGSFTGGANRNFGGRQFGGSGAFANRGFGGGQPGGQRMGPGGNSFAGRGSTGATGRSGFGGGQFTNSGRSQGQWNGGNSGFHGSSNSGRSYAGGNSYRSTPSYGGNFNGSRAQGPRQSFGGAGFRSAPSSGASRGGSFGGGRSFGGNSFHGGNGGGSHAGSSFHGGGGGGGSHGGGGGSHGGGGGHGGRR